METQKSAMLGFTLIELLVTLVVIGILAALAIPEYKKYTQKARYTELVQAAVPFKLGVAECTLRTSQLKDCANGRNGVPPVPEASGLIKSVTVAKDGAITVTPSAESKHFSPTDTYVLQPTLADSGRINWALDEVKSGCFVKGLC